MRIASLIAGGLLLVASVAHAADGASAKQPNIIFILADDKYEYLMANVRFWQEMACFRRKSSSSQITLDCGRFRAIASN